MRILLIVLAIAFVLGAFVLGGWILFIRWARNPLEFPLPPISSSHFLNVAPSATYVGSSTCAECHPRESATYRQTGHSRAFADIAPDSEPEGIVFSHDRSGREYRVEERDGTMHHAEVMRAADGTVLASSEYPIRFAIGSGRHTRSYLVEEDGFLMQSPITWYASTHRWSMSPGYDTEHHWGFGRMVGTDCLSCHTGALDAEQQRYRDIRVQEQSIGCERCHGPGSLHVERHRQGKVRESADLTIVHPDALSRPLLEGVCGQCHQQSAVSVGVRGRNAFEFRPGLPLTDFSIDYRSAEDSAGMTVTGHVEQLRLSRCYQQSEELTCTTCHAMHDPPQDRPSYYRQKCVECHETSKPCTEALKLRDKTSPLDNCVACHMPSSDTEIPHVAFTHHRIAVHKNQPVSSRPSEPVLEPVEDITRLPDIERERCLGLAYLQFSEKCDVEEVALSARGKSMQLLTSVYDRGLQDGETLVALAKLFAGQDSKIAEELAIRAVADRQVSITARGEALFLLADIYFKSRRHDHAVQQLTELVKLRRVYEDWFLLGTCHFLAGRTEMGIEALEQARRINPFRPEVHQLLSRSYARLGQNDAAARHLKLQESLNLRSKTD